MSEVWWYQLEILDKIFVEIVNALGEVQWIGNYLNPAPFSILRFVIKKHLNKVSSTLC